MNHIKLKSYANNIQSFTLTEEAGAILCDLISELEINDVKAYLFYLIKGIADLSLTLPKLVDSENITGLYYPDEIKNGLFIVSEFYKVLNGIQNQ